MTIVSLFHIKRKTLIKRFPLTHELYLRQAIKKQIDKSYNFSTGILVFEDGTKFFGNGIGFEGKAVGEVCFKHL